MTKEQEKLVNEALHKALKVLNCLNNDRVYETAWVNGAINACEEALALSEKQHIFPDKKQPAQEPVAWMNDIAFSMDKELLGTRSRIVPLYIHPAPLQNKSAESWQGNKEFVGLSDDEILEIDKSIDPKISIGKGKTLFARAIEQALKEKNT